MADTPLPRPLCRGTTNAGNPCKKRAAAGSAYCGVHGGAKRKVGRPTKLTRDLVDTIAEAVEAGLTYERAAQIVGIHRATIIEWRERGRVDLEARRPSVFADLADALTPASARGELALVKIIREAAADDWRAAAHLLAARHPERWARRTAVDVTTAEVSKPRMIVPTEDRAAAIMDTLRTAMSPPPSTT